MIVLLGGQCPLRVNRRASIQFLGEPLSVVAPIATKLLQRSEGREVPIAANRTAAATPLSYL
jgi:hypothetical protein